MKPFITGTAAYGPFTDESDIDIVMMYYDAERFEQKLEDAGFVIKYPNKDVNPNYYVFAFDMAGRTFQIVSVVNQDEYEDWLYATEEMRKLIQVKDREKRVKLFQNLRLKNVGLSFGY